MKVRIFDKQNLDILSTLVFDAELGLEEVEKLPELLHGGKITLNLRRRGFDQVERRKAFLFFNKTILTGIEASLTIERVTEITENVSESNLNDFIQSVYYDSDKLSLIIETINFPECIKFTVEDGFRITLHDYDYTNYGKGEVFGEIGFTKEEWAQKIRGRGVKESKN